MKKLVTILLSLLLVFTLASCGSPSQTTTSQSNSGSSSKTKDMTIGFIPMTLNNEYFITMVNGAKEKAGELGVTMNVQAGDSHADANGQLTIVENMITSGIDALVIVPSSSQSLGQALKECKDKGIPVINLDTKIDKSVLDEAGVTVPFFGTNNYNGAKLAGQYVAKNFPKGTKTAILKGIEGQQNAADRYNGFVDGAGDTVNVVAVQTANWEVDQGYTAAQNIINANPDIQLFFCSNDNMAIGAVRAIEEAGKQNQIKVIGFDGVSEALDLVESGKMLCTVAQDPAQMGKLGIENAIKLVNGETVEQNVDTGSKLITKDNVADQKAYTQKYAK